MRLLLIITTRSIIYYRHKRQISTFDSPKYIITMIVVRIPLYYTTVTETVSSPLPRHVHQSHACKNHVVRQWYKYVLQGALHEIRPRDRSSSCRSSIVVPENVRLCNNVIVLLVLSEMTFTFDIRCSRVNRHFHGLYFIKF